LYQDIVLGDFAHGSEMWSGELTLPTR